MGWTKSIVEFLNNFLHGHRDINKALVYQYDAGLAIGQYEALVIRLEDLNNMEWVDVDHAVALWKFDEHGSPFWTK